MIVARDRAAGIPQFARMRKFGIPREPQRIISEPHAEETRGGGRETKGPIGVVTLIFEPNGTDPNAFLHVLRGQFSFPPLPGDRPTERNAPFAE